MAVPAYEPMLATPWRAPFDHPDWWFEVKWDGVRVIVTIDGSTVDLRSRTGRSMSDIYPEFQSLTSRQPVVIDGEIVALDDNGVPSFSLLQKRMNATGSRARALAETVPLTLMAFDLLHLKMPLLSEPLEQRWALLDSVLPKGPVRSQPIRAEGLAFYSAVVERGLEGMGSNPPWWPWWNIGNGPTSNISEPPCSKGSQPIPWTP